MCILAGCRMFIPSNSLRLKKWVVRGPALPTFLIGKKKKTNLTVEGLQSSNINSTKGTKNIANNHQLEITWVYKNLPPQNENHAGTISQQKSIRDRERKNGTLLKAAVCTCKMKPGRSYKWSYRAPKNDLEYG